MRICVTAITLALLVGCSETTTKPGRADLGAFSARRVDFGIVVSDIAKSATFYAEGLGLTEVEPFDVPATLGGDAGLSDDKPFHVRVFKVADDPDATQVKLMQFPDAPGKPIDNRFIHTTLGISYLTLFVSDITTSVERAKKAGACPLAKGPIPLPEGFPKGLYLAVVRDPDGNLIELVGPKTR